MRTGRWIAKVARFFPLLLVLFGALPALARLGGGEHFDSGNSSSDGGGGGGDLSGLIQLLIWLVFEHPAIGVPLVVVVLVVVLVQRKNAGDGSTRKALDRLEAERRTTASAGAVQGWVSALTAKDPQFDLMAFFDRTRRLFTETQEAWFRRDLTPVRPLLSDASFQRLEVQLRILERQGVRDALAEPKVLDLQLIGLEQNDTFDTVHVRVTAQVRDADAPASATDDQARAMAMKSAPERFIEVWSFVRRPGAKTKIGEDVFQGKCPNCGALFNGGASNVCEYCKAIVNSGNYDWVLASITQGSEFRPAQEAAQGFARARQADPGLSVEMLEDRAALAFWTWVSAQQESDAGQLSKLATPDFVKGLGGEVEALRASGRRRAFLECAVGSVDTQQFSQEAGVDLASVEIRWSARLGVVAINDTKKPSLASQPQRWVMVLQRASGAKTVTEHGMATNRCPNCHAPLTDNGQTSCEYCGAALASGERDWVVRDFGSWEWWRAGLGKGWADTPRPAATRVPDRDERERLVYMMAAMAMADGVVDAKERALLRMASERWGIPWANVELALNSGTQLFDKLLARGSVEAETFLQELVTVALADGKVDPREKKLLQTAAAHLGLADRLEGMLRS